MDHIAILNKRWILEKIISGEKEVESRWYTQRRTPYKNIHKDDNIYFKESGCPIIAKARVEKTLFFEDLNKDKIKHILKEYGKQIGVDASYANKVCDKKFCTLIFLKDVTSITPFNINKKGYGMMSAWITVQNISTIRN